MQEAENIPVEQSQDATPTQEYNPPTASMSGPPMPEDQKVDFNPPPPPEVDASVPAPTVDDTPKVEGEIVSVKDDDGEEQIPEVEETDSWQEYMNELKNSDNPDDQKEYQELLNDEKEIEEEIRQERRAKAKAAKEASMQDEVDAEEEESKDPTIEADFSKTDNIVEARDVPHDEDGNEIIEEDHEEDSLDAEDQLVEEELEVPDAADGLADAIDQAEGKKTEWSDAELETRGEYLKDRVLELDDDSLENLLDVARQEGDETFTNEEKQVIVQELNRRSYESEVGTKAIMEVHEQLVEQSRESKEKYDGFVEKTSSYVDTLNNKMNFEMPEGIADFDYKFTDNAKAQISDANNFIKQFVNEDGSMKEERIPELAQAMLFAKESKQIIKTVASHVEAQTIKRQAMEAKNINMDPRKDKDSEITTKSGTKVNTRPEKTAFLYDAPKGRVKVKAINS